MAVRPPSVEMVIRAFNAFVRYRCNENMPVQDTQITHIMAALRYLQQNNPDIEGFGLATKDLRMALKALSFQPYDEGNTARLQLAKAFYEELERRRLLGSESEEGLESSVVKGSILARNLNPYLKILSACGQPVEARTLVEQYFESDLKRSAYAPWVWVIKGFLRLDAEDEVLKTIDVMRSLKMPFSQSVHQSITSHYANKGDLESMKRWYNTAMDDEGLPLLRATEDVLEACIRAKEYEWGDSVFRTIFERRVQTSKGWNLILRWSAAKGKGVDEIERMMNVMLRRNEDLPDREHVVPDITMINGLIQLAMSRDDPYTAERYVVLGLKWKIEPDAQTMLLQLEYRIRVGDLDGAKVSYIRLRSEDTSNDLDVPIVNKLIVALIERKEPYNAIMSIVEDLSERNATLELPTITALCQLYLQRDEPDEIGPLLSTHTHSYSVLQRESLRDVFVKFILDRKNPDSQAWDAYTIFSSTFPEAPISIRIDLMSEFFSRGCTDMGMHLFGYMRQQQNPLSRANVEAYTRCFVGLARAGAKYKSVYLVYNQLKVDPQIEPNTRLKNGLMIAYTACGLPDLALEFWNDIAHSREGPTYSSIQLALQACEKARFGERAARDIWARLRRFGIQVTREIYAAYVGALSGQVAFQECVGLIESAEAEIGYKPDSLLIGTFYNAARGKHNKGQVEIWARQAYPDVWEELVAMGMTVVRGEKRLELAPLEDGEELYEEEIKQRELMEEYLASQRQSVFNIDRSVEP
ncbi:MAG: hypothetical protein HETSPECPRED_005515 [Heterodermia speciosa]|uniref:Uncharacterized protein n=1 Tax=Heterodermia speciosa TaxID=116794 RepID=A0A8H3FJY5_9LECA|nr:MAG: hypothetical protein HETSPECPRED_005515 [Heterodermia speciosa]